ncbi:hypothetical protein HK100_009125 [Physocladia obscura]|uniref:Transcription factor IIIC 90kDa subunit N-terminal domain-containing protein n=1 Tax=Physocladia obscura TaxID=109957 RepID=A0AAD5XI53_9FUNG|nr:hypothetical protein HK100_009125 [Physocladia obscura]
MKITLNGAPVGTDCVAMMPFLMQAAIAVGTSPSAALVTLNNATGARDKVSIASTAPPTASTFDQQQPDADLRLFAPQILSQNATRITSVTYVQKSRDNLLVVVREAKPAPIAAAAVPLIVTITSSANVLIFSPKKHIADSLWIQVADLLPLLMAHYNVPLSQYASPTLVDYSTAELLHSNCLGWSEMHFCIPKSISQSVCFLSIGSRDGTITIWRFSENSQPTFQTSIKPQSGWVTKISWSPWISSVGGGEECTISAYTDGAVYSHIVKFTANTNTLTFTQMTLLCAADSRPATVIKFHSAPTLRCAISKATTIIIWIPILSPAQTSTVPLPATDSNVLGNLMSLKLPLHMPVGGITWALTGDEVKIYGVEGKSFVVTIVGPNAGENDAVDGLNTVATSGLNQNGDVPSSSDSSYSSFSNNIVSTATLGSGLVLLEDMTQFFAKQILGAKSSTGVVEDEVGGEDNNDTGGGVEVSTPGSSSVNGKQVRYFGAISSPNGLVDIVLYTVNSSEGLAYQTEKTNNCAVFVHWNYTRGRRNQLIEDRIFENIMGVVGASDCRNSDLFNHISPSCLLWDVIEYLRTDSMEPVEVVLKEFDLVNRLLSGLKCVAEDEKYAPKPVKFSINANEHPNFLFREENNCAIAVTKL